MTQEEHELRAALEELGRDLDRMTDEGERSNRTSLLRRSVHASPSRPRGLTREMIDLTGERFGRLKVIGYLGRIGTVPGAGSAGANAAGGRSPVAATSGVVAPRVAAASSTTS